MLVAGVAGEARGPGSCETPVKAGVIRGVGAAEAKAGRSKSAPASDATVAAIFMWRFMAATPVYLSVTE
jgi:hypothetical protein